MIPLHLLRTVLAAATTTTTTTIGGRRAAATVAATAALSQLSSFLRSPTRHHFTERKFTLLLGCVAYCDQVTSIWDGMRRYFVTKKSLPFDFVLFTSYERLLEALLDGQIDVAWNGPLAHVRLQRLAPGNTISLGMRDADRDFVSYLFASKDSGVSSWSDLKGKRLATGSYDSPQAYVVPMHYLLSTLPPSIVKTIAVTRYDIDLGKHGDTAIGEIGVMNALRNGDADAGFVSKLMYDRLDPSDVIKAGALLPVPVFDHCQFDALSTLSVSKRQSFQRAVLEMNWQQPDEREVMALEGIRERWEPPRESGYDILRAAIATEEVSIAPQRNDSIHPFLSLTSVDVVEEKK